MVRQSLEPDQPPSSVSLKQGDEPEPTMQETYERIQAELLKNTVDVAKGDVPFVQGQVFTTFICMMVVLNTLQMGLEADDPDRPIWFWTENIFTAAFMLEFVLKLCFLRGKYFHDKGNWLDGALAIMAAFDNWCLALLGPDLDLQSFSILRVLRMARIVRILRLVKAFKRFVLIIAGVIDAIRTTCWVGCVLGLAIYVCAIFCVGYLGKNAKDLYPGYTEDTVEIDEFEVMVNYNPFTSFGSMGRAMLTLFNIAILAEWSEVIRPIAEKQPFMVLFFIMFVLFVTFGIMNVIIGMIVDNVMSNAHNMQVMNERKEAERKVGIFQDIKHVCRSELDVDGDGIISREELAESMQKGTLRSLLDAVNLPQGCSPQELYFVLDQSGDGALTCDEFIQGFYRLMQNDDFQSKVMFQLGIHHCKYLILDLQNENRKQFEALHAMCQAEFQGLRRQVLDMKPQDCNGRGGLRLPTAETPMSDVLERCSGSPEEADAKAREDTLCASLIAASGLVSSSIGNRPAPIRPRVLTVNSDDFPTFGAPQDGGAGGTSMTGGKRPHARTAGSASGASMTGGPGDRDDTHRDLKRGAAAGLRIVRDIEAARRQRTEATTAPCNGLGRREGYEELAGCLDAVCNEVQEAVSDAVRDAVTEWLASVEKATHEECVTDSYRQ